MQVEALSAAGGCERKHALARTTRGTRLKARVEAAPGRSRVGASRRRAAFARAYLRSRARVGGCVANFRPFGEIKSVATESAMSRQATVRAC